MGAVPTRIFAGDASVKEADLLTMSRETFAAMLRTTFSTESAEGRAVTLVLTAVTDETHAPVSAVGAAPVLDTFALEFSGAGEALTQGTYRFQHARLGTISLFIVPSGRFTSIATVNHLKTPLPAGYMIPRRAQKATAPAAAGIHPVERPGIRVSQKALANG